MIRDWNLSSLALGVCFLYLNAARNLEELISWKQTKLALTVTRTDKWPFWLNDSAWFTARSQWCRLQLFWFKRANMQTNDDTRLTSNANLHSVLSISTCFIQSLFPFYLRYFIYIILYYISVSFFATKAARYIEIICISHMLQQLIIITV